jgi:flavin-dependent dehydrogenase
MKIKGSHNAMKSGIEAGKALYKSLTKNTTT